MDPILLLKKLTQYACKLMKLVDETEQTIEERRNVYDSTSYLHLKESSMILSKLLACLIKIRFEIQELPECHLLTLQTLEDDAWDSKNPFDRAIDAANDAVSRTEVLLDILDVKLSFFSDAHPMFVTNKCAKENSSLIPSKELSLPSIAETVIELENEEKSKNDIKELETNGNKGTARLDTPESSLQSAYRGKQSIRKFEMKRFTGSGNVREFISFWEEFQETVGSSPLSNKYKFAALRSLVRGEPYRVFLNLNYCHDGVYEEAWNRLFNKYADEELARRNLERKKVVRSLSTIVENQSVTSPEEWSDAYFFEKYCKLVPNYETPNTDTVVGAMRTFLKFYIQGPNFFSNKDLASAWLILLHKAIYQLDSYENFQRQVPGSSIFGDQKTLFSPSYSGNQGHIFSDTEVDQWRKFWYEELSRQPKLILQPQSQPASPVYPASSLNQVSSPIYQANSLMYHSDFRFTVTNQQNQMNDSQYELKIKNPTLYFALLSIVLFQVVFSSSKSIEKFLKVSFDAISKDFCSISGLPKLVPPHPNVYHFIKTSLFQPNSSAFKTYLTYLVGFYCRGPENVKKFLTVGCMPFIERLSASSMYWLERASASVHMKPQDFLKLLLVDPSMEVSATKIHRILEKYKDQFSWRWARLFENYRLPELCVGENPELSYACFVFHLYSMEMAEREEYPEEFSRFIEDEEPPSLTGKNLGIFLKEMLHAYSGLQVD